MLRALWPVTQQFQNKNGSNLISGKIYIYYQGRTALATTYHDEEGTVVNSNPVLLDNNGRATVFADTAYSYTIVVCDYYGKELFSQDITLHDVTESADEITLIGSDGSIHIDTSSSNGVKTFDMSANTDILATKKSVDDLDVRVKKNEGNIKVISGNVENIATEMSGKKDKQTELNFNGSATKTVTNISQDANGEITVTYEDIDLPSQVPNVEITSEDNSVNITSSVDAGTNTKTFDLSVNGQGGGSGTSYTAGDGIDITYDTISVKYGKGLEIDESGNLEVAVMQGATSSNDGKSGIVPKPLSGQENHILTGNGKWMHRLGDAPADGNLYGQKNGTWQQINEVISNTEVEPVIFQVNEHNKFVTVYSNDTVNELNIPSFNSFISSYCGHVRLYNLPNGMLAASNGGIINSYPSIPDVVTSNNDAYTVSELFPNVEYTGISLVHSHDDTIYFGTLIENISNKPIYLLSYDKYTRNKSIIWYSGIDSNITKGFSSLQYIDDTYFISYFSEGTTNVYKIIAVRNEEVTELCSNSSIINGVIKVNNHYIAFNRTEYKIFDLDLNYVTTRNFNTDYGVVRLINLQQNSPLVCTQNGTLIRINDDFSYESKSLPNTSNMLFRSISYVTDDNIAYFNGVKDNISTVFEVNIDNLHVISTNVYNDTMISNCRSSVVYKAVQKTTQVQSDWNEHNVNSPAYINNKPDFDWKDISNSVTKNISGGSYNVLYNQALKMICIDFKIDLFNVNSTDYIDILTLNNYLYKPKFTNIACSCYAILSNGSTDSLTCIAFVEDTGKMKMKFNSVNILANISIHVMYTV